MDQPTPQKDVTIKVRYNGVRVGNRCKKMKGYQDVGAFSNTRIGGCLCLIGVVLGVIVGFMFGGV